MRTTLLAIAIFAVIALGAYAVMESRTAPGAAPTPAQPAGEPSERMTGEPAGPGDAVASAGRYAAYSEQAVAESQAERIYLFFHAAWCPTCRALDADIRAQAAALPVGVEIYQVDYDSETELKSRYGVVRQHSVVRVDKAGNPESAIFFPFTLETLLAESSS